MQEPNRFDMFDGVVKFCREKLAGVTADTFAWFGLVIIHMSTIPTLLTVMSGLNDKMPPVDTVLFVWAGLGLFFVRAALRKDLLNLVTIGTGFVIHATLLALVVYK